MFRTEMAAQVRPSLDGMPAEVLAKGRRPRRARTAKITATAFAAVAAGIIAVAVAGLPAGSGHATATHVGAVAKSARPSHPATRPVTEPSSPAAPTGGGTPASSAVMLADAHIRQSPGPKAPTTAAAVLDELLKLLPPGPPATTPSIRARVRRARRST